MSDKKGSPDMLEIQNLLNLEARYLNRADFDSWMSLYTEDGVYWMPLDAGQTDPEAHDSIFYENRTLMEVRKRNFEHQLSPSMQYPIRSSRIISDVHLQKYDPDSNSCIINSSFQAVMVYKEQTVYAGSFQHHLVSGDTGYRIKMKRVDLLNADMPLSPIMIYL
jgi:benzoate/toluate 1,2-dioxygenase subunit beta